MSAGSISSLEIQHIEDYYNRFLPSQRQLNDIETRLKKIALQSLGFDPTKYLSDYNMTTIALFMPARDIEAMHCVCRGWNDKLRYNSEILWTHLAGIDLRQFEGDTFHDRYYTALQTIALHTQQAKKYIVSVSRTMKGCNGYVTGNEMVRQIAKRFPIARELNFHRFTDIRDLSPLSAMRNLRKIDFQGISVRDLEALRSSKHTLEDVRVYDMNIAFLAHCPKLKKLDVSIYVESSFESLRLLKQIEELVIHSICISTENLSVLNSCTRLKKLTVISINIDQVSEESLRAQLSNCTQLTEISVKPLPPPRVRRTDSAMCYRY